LEVSLEADELNAVETGLAIYAAITLYYSVLGTYILVKTNVISRKASPILVGYIVLQWTFSRLIYIYFPDVPSTYIGIPSILNEIVMAPQTILTSIYIFVKSKIIKLEWKPYLMGYLFTLGMSRLTEYMLYISKVYFPVPEIFVLRGMIPVWVWFGRPGIFSAQAIRFLTLTFWLFFFGSISLWFYVWVKTNSVYGLKSGIFYIGYGALRGVIQIMLYLNFPYPVMAAINVFVDYPLTILELILIDRYRLRNLGVKFRF